MKISSPSITAKDLNRLAPHSPRIRTGGYVILARTADKCRALLADTLGEYHYDCPLDNVLFGFKGIHAEDFKRRVAQGASDEDLAQWLDTHGTQKTADEVKEWSDTVELYMPYNDPERKEWFIGMCREAGIDPAKNSIFDFLEADDKATFSK